ncbi:MAG: lysoplasmalogenase family protein [Saprospiraceae bacterium]|nr:lysoplasmalogenase family protein [Saprospiraceae bacterium]
METALGVPVGAYGLTIMTILLTALNHWKTVPQKTFQWDFLSAILFVVSDSILAIDKFVPIPQIRYF